MTPADLHLLQSALLCGVVVLCGLWLCQIGNERNP